MGTLAISIDLPPSGELETGGVGASPTQAQMAEELRARQAFVDTVSPYLTALPGRSPRRLGNVSRVELLGRTVWSELNHYLLLVTVDVANPGIDAELSALLPAGSRVSVTGYFDGLPDWQSRTTLARVGPGRADPAHVTLAGARTWALSTAERAFATFAASFLSAVVLAGAFSIPALDAALFAAATAALSVVTAAIRSLSPPTEDKTLDVVTRVGLTLLQAFTAAFVTSTAGAAHFGDWRAGALAGLAAAFSAVKGAVAVRLPPSGERPTPASLITLRTGVPQALVSSEATA